MQKTRHRLRALILLACLLASLATVPPASASVRGYVTVSDANPLANAPVTLTFHKEKDATDLDQTGTMAVSFNGPQSGTLPSKSYSLPAVGAQSQTLTWTWTPSYIGSYTFTFTDTPTAGTRTDASTTLTVKPGWTDWTYHAGTLRTDQRFFVTDLNSDGAFDALGSENGIAHFIQNPQTRTMGKTTIAYTTPWRGSLNYLDYNQDGQRDVIWSQYTETEYSNQVIQFFQPMRADPYDIPGYQYYYTSGYIPKGQGSVVDLNQDGSLDLVMTIESSSFVVAWHKSFASYYGYCNPQCGPGFVGAPFYYYGTTTYPNTGFTYVADGDQDGRLDVLAAKGDQLSFYFNLGNTEWGEPRFSLQTVAYIPANLYLDVQSFDLDKDGRQDLILDAADDTQVCFQGTDFGYDCRSFGYGGWPSAIGDLNGDGRLDLVTRTSSGDGAFVRINDGTRNLWPSYTVATGPCCANAFATWNLDGDNQVDLVYRRNGEIHGANLYGFGPIPPTLVATTQAYTSSGATTSQEWGTWSAAPGTTVQGSNFLKATNSGTSAATVTVSVGSFSCSCGTSFNPANRIQFEYATGSAPTGPFTSTGYGSGTRSLSVPAGQTLWLRYSLQLPTALRDGSYQATVSFA